MKPIELRKQHPNIGQRCLVFNKDYSWTFAYWLRDGLNYRFEEWHQGKMTIIEADYWMPEPLPPIKDEV